MPKPPGAGNGGSDSPTFAIVGLDSDGYLTGTGDPVLDETTGEPTRELTITIDDGTTTWVGTTVDWRLVDGTWYWFFDLSTATNPDLTSDTFADESGTFTVVASYEEEHKNGRMRTTESDAYELTVDGVDTEAPTGSTPDLLASSDSGDSTTDNLTNGTLLSFRIGLDATVQLGDTVELVVNGSVDVSHVITQGDLDAGFVDLTGTGAYLLETDNQIQARFFDDAGNESTTAALTVTLDTTTPQAGIPDLLASSDTGADDQDNLTTDSTATFRIAISAAAVGDVLVLKVDGAAVASKTLDETDIANGYVDLTASDLGASGAKSVTAEIGDAAGNSSTSAALDIVFDGDAPGGSTPDLLASSDTGDSSTDDLTSGSALSFSIALNASVAVGDTVELMVFGTADVSHEITQGDLDAGFVVLTSTNTSLVEGSNQIAARFSDPAGNQTTTGALTVTRDTGTPQVAAPDLVAASDTGDSDIDNLTADATPTFRIGIANAEAGDVVVLKVDGVEAASRTLDPADIANGWVELTAGAFAASGAKSITAEISDAAGNFSSSGELVIQYDGDAPTAAAPNLVAASDSGTANNDNVTNAADPVFRIALDGSVAAGDVVTLRIDGSDDASHTVLATDISQGYVELSPAGPVGEGVHVFSTRIDDAAGNSSTSGDLSVTIDRSAPSAPSAPDLDAASDTGSSSTDNVTGDDTPTISGTAEANAVVRISDGVTQIGQTTANGSGAWSLTLPTLAAGVHSLTATATDAAGNVSPASAALELTIDTSTAPATISGLTADDGTPDADGITGDTTPTFAGEAAAGATVELFLVGGGSLGSTTASDGTWSIEASALGHGDHQVYAVATDLAGNQTTTADYAFSIDTQVDTAEITGITDDTGTAGDNLTSDTTPQLLGNAEPGSTVMVYPVIGGVADQGNGFAAVVDPDGSWAADPGTLAEGTHVFRAMVTDAQGNTAWTGDLSVTVDTSVTEATVGQVLVDDGGNPDSQPLPQGTPTTDTSPLVRGAAERLALVEVFLDGTLVGSTTADGNGDWEYGLSGLSAGLHTLTFRTTDSAGNAAGGPADDYTYEIMVEDPPPPPPPVEGDPTAEPLYGTQWNLDMINAAEVWSDYNGSGIHVVFYDDGVEYTHSDLDDNYNAAAHLIYAEGTSGEILLDPYPVTASDARHGTAVAGVIGAEANGEGTVGIAWGSMLTGVNIFSGPAYINDSAAADVFDWAIRQMYRFDIASHSWGAAPVYLNDTSATTVSFRGGAETAVETGRGGLGTIVLKAAGNWSDSSQGDYSDSTRHTITVAAYDSDGDASWYSNRGANLLVSAPASGLTEADSNGNLIEGSDLRIPTTDRTGADSDGNPYGYSDGDWSSSTDTSGFGGTSAATPTVSGVVALMLEANPGLGWRDVQNILAYSAHQVGSETGVQNTTTEEVPVDLDADGVFETTAERPIEFFPGQYNGGNNWNGGGVRFSHDYGHGSVDARNAVRMSEVWNLFGPAQTSANEATASTGALSPSLSTTGNGDTDTWQFTYSGDAMDLEYVDISIDLSTMLMQEVTLEITSPSGTTATLLDLPLNDYTPAFTFFGVILVRANITWTFGANAFRGEDPNGVWTVRMEEKNATYDTDNFGTEAEGNRLDGLSLDFYGTADDPANGVSLDDDVYHYTDEVVTLDLADDPDRLELDDTDAGTDWLNFAAMTSDLLVDLRPGASTYSEAGTAAEVEIVRLIGATDIENAVAGDGDDELIGNSGANRLFGMRGNDVIRGGDGGDEIFGHFGNDDLWGGAGLDVFFFEPGHGNDRILDFDTAEDVVSLSGFSQTTFGELDISSGTDPVLSFASGESITFVGSAPLGTDNFVFGESALV